MKTLWSENEKLKIPNEKLEKQKMKNLWWKNENLVIRKWKPCDYRNENLVIKKWKAKDQKMKTLRSENENQGKRKNEKLKIWKMKT